MEYPSADEMGRLFAKVYYKDLIKGGQPGSKYYTSISHLIRAEAGCIYNIILGNSRNGIEVITSMVHENCKPKIFSVDSLGSLDKAIFVLVTGAMHKGDTTREFVQSFLLSLQDGKLRVLYDIFRYLVEEKESDSPSVDNYSDGTRESSEMPSSTGATSEASGFASSATGEEALVAERPEILYCNREAADRKQLGTEGATYHQVLEELLHEDLRPGKQFASKHDDVLPSPWERGPAEKMSYAAILQRGMHTLSGTTVSSHRPVFTPRQSSPQRNMDFQLSHARAHALTEAKKKPNSSEKKVDLKSVFVKNLPVSMTNKKLEAEMSRFGPLQPNQITLRTSKVGPLYAFVHFKDSTSAQAAIEASPIQIEGRTIKIEKRTSIYSGDHRRGHGREAR